MSDRVLQDEVIRALADAPYRASDGWRRRALADPERVERFARFLARHFYFERVVHFFKYSRALARVTGRSPEAILRQPRFDTLLPTIVLGSGETARAVTGLVRDFVRTGTSRPPYHDDLLRYEAAMMVAEAGPRRWRETGKGEGGMEKGTSPEVVEGTVLLELDYDLPAVLPKLLQPWTVTPDAPRRATTLLVARSKHGRVAVARAEGAVASVVQLADGTKTLEDLARAVGLRPAELAATLDDLTEIGAVRFSTGS
ncbi:MAG TPA: hypothetical protein VGQ06_00650 [Gemmatimonadales bacterium]|nr:hypothetical protein [Gemmatimonadales bacterium]